MMGCSISKLGTLSLEYEVPNGGIILLSLYLLFAAKSAEARNEGIKCKSPMTNDVKFAKIIGLMQ